MGHADWRDMSEYIVHLTGPDEIVTIFQAATIEARTPTGTARSLAGLDDSQKSVCLSEIPIGHLSRLTRRGEYGVGFYKQFIDENDGQMVTYLRKGTPAADRFQTLVTDAMTGGINPADPLWRITQFVDNPGSYGETRYEFEWEREWRVPHDLRFAENKVAFLLAPEKYHDWMRRTAWRALARAAYGGVVLDPHWDFTRVQDELRANGGSLA
jgi:hypothetical protein